MRTQERISFSLHAFGVLLALAGTVLLLLSARSAVERIVSIVYGLSTVFLFTSSSLYHAMKREDDEVSFYRKLDHAAIFFMIAGTYTAVCSLYLDGSLPWIIIAIQWSLVIVGVLFRFFFMKAPRILYTACYLAMGWLAIILIDDLFRALPPLAFSFLVAGGVAYTIGAGFYLAKRPRATFGFHEIWHVFILVGAFFHYLMVYVRMIA